MPPVIPPMMPPFSPATAPWVTHTLTLYPEHLDIPGGTTIACDKGVSDLTFTKTDNKNEWQLYVTCNGQQRAYRITIQ